MMRAERKKEQNTGKNIQQNGGKRTAKQLVQKEKAQKESKNENSGTMLRSQREIKKQGITEKRIGKRLIKDN